MFNTAKIAELNARKRLLVAESELNRQNLLAELNSFRGVASQIERLTQATGSWSKLLLLMGSLVGGVLLTPKSDGKRGWLAKALFGLRIVKRLKRLWGVFRPRTAAKYPDPHEIPPSGRS